MRGSVALVAGAELEVALWRGRFGIAIAASRQAGIDGTGPSVTAVDASVRVLLLRHLMPSLLEPRDAELGVEVQGIVERTWWDNVDRECAPIGFGFVVRLRGGSDEFSNLIAESVVRSRVRVAMPDPVLAELIATLDPTAVFVLLPKAEYAALATSWGLPAI